MKKIMNLALFLGLLLMVSCSQQQSQNAIPQIPDTPQNNQLPEIKPVIVQGKLGEDLSDNHVKIKVLDYGPVEYVNGRNYLSLKVSIENLGDDSVDVYNNFKIYGSLTDNYGQVCDKSLVDKYSNIVLPVKLAPRQKAEGILPCPVAFDVDGKLNSLNVVLEFDDIIPWEKISQYAPGSKYGNIKINVYSYNDIKDFLAASGNKGQEISTKLSWNSIKVNSYQLLNGIGTLSDYSSKTYPPYECGKDWPEYERLAQKQGFLGAAGTTKAHCQLLKVSIIVKNKGYFEQDSSPSAYQLGITNLKSVSGTDGFNYRPVHEVAFNQLDSPINLKGMKPGEERTGDVIFSVTKYIDLVGGVEKSSMFKYSYGVELKSTLN